MSGNSDKVAMLASIEHGFARWTKWKEIDGDSSLARPCQEPDDCLCVKAIHKWQVFFQSSVHGMLKALGVGPGLSEKDLTISCSWRPSCLNLNLPSFFFRQTYAPIFLYQLPSIWCLLEKKSHLPSLSIHGRLKPPMESCLFHIEIWKTKRERCQSDSGARGKTIVVFGSNFVMLKFYSFEKKMAKGMRSFNIASGAAGRDVSSPRSHQMWWISGPNRPRILLVNIFETSDLDLLDLCWMSPDTLRWQLWRSEWWCPETHVRLRGFLSNCAHVVLFFSCFEDQSWNVILWHTQWILDGLLWTEALTEATARSVSCLVLKQANPVHDAFSIIYHLNRKWYFH